MLRFVAAPPTIAFGFCKGGVIGQCGRVAFHTHGSFALGLVGQGEGHFHGGQVAVGLNHHADADLRFDVEKLGSFIVQQIGRNVFGHMNGQCAFAEFARALVNLA